MVWSVFLCGSCRLSCCKSQELCHPTHWQDCRNRYLTVLIFSSLKKPSLSFRAFAHFQGFFGVRLKSSDEHMAIIYLVENFLPSRELWSSSHHRTTEIKAVTWLFALTWLSFCMQAMSSIITLSRARHKSWSDYKVGVPSSWRAYNLMKACAHVPLRVAGCSSTDKFDCLETHQYYTTSILHQFWIACICCPYLFCKEKVQCSIFWVSECIHPVKVACANFQKSQLTAIASCRYRRYRPALSRMSLSDTQVAFLLSWETLHVQYFRPSICFQLLAVMRECFLNSLPWQIL